MECVLSDCPSKAGLPHKDSDKKHHQSVVTVQYRGKGTRSGMTVLPCSVSTLRHFSPIQGALGLGLKTPESQDDQGKTLTTYRDHRDRTALCQEALLLVTSSTESMCLPCSGLPGGRGQGEAEGRRGRWSDTGLLVPASASSNTQWKTRGHSAEFSGQSPEKGRSG